MKKFFALMLALVMALSLVACGSKADTTADDKTDDPAAAEPANALEKIKADGTRQQDRIPHNFSSSRSISGSIIAHFRGDCNFILAGRERPAFVNLHGAAHLSGRCCMYIHQIPINSE